MNITFQHSIFCLLIIFLGVLRTSDLYAQRTCGSVHPMSSENAHDPEVKKRYEEFEKKLKERSQKKNSSEVTVISVVFHIIHNGDLIGSVENISNDLINAQLMQLNDDFRRMNSDQSNTWSQASDTEIEFCLATVDPSGNATSGILRYNMQGGPWTNADFNSGVKHQTIWNRDQYLNIWSANLAGDLLGYAQFPGGSATTDGVVCLSSSFGSITNPQSGGSPYNLGRTLTHEVGHWLGLYHIWRDVIGCGGSDEISDTPNQEEESRGCPSGVQLDACAPSSTGYMYQNYMDYTYDACMNLFTADQRTRMKAAIAEFRSGLNSSKCVAMQPIVANFTPNNGSLEVCPNEQIQFIDISTGPVTSRMWTLSGAGVTPTFSSEVNPIVQFSSTGTIIATLTASNNFDSNIKQAFIDVAVLDENSIDCQVQPCLEFHAVGGPYADLYYADGLFTSCPGVEVGSEVSSGVAYILTGLLAGNSYTLEFCNGYDANLWDAVITIGKYDQANAKALPNSVVDYVNDCSITFTPTASDDYIAVISSAGNCNGDFDQRQNGFLTFGCNNSEPIEVCGLEFLDNGGKNNTYNLNQNKVYMLCPIDTGCEKLSLVFDEFELEASSNCLYDYMIIYDGMGLDKEVIGTYCGTNSPGTIVSKASSGCLTIQFVSDDDTSAAGWIATINCLDDGSCGNECPDGYSLSGVESGNGGPDNNGIYNANGSIHSTQEVLNGALIYNGKRSVYLNPEFLIENNATVEIYLDGCGTNSETKE